MILFFLSSLYLHLYLINVESFAKEEAALEISVSTIGLTTCKQSFHIIDLNISLNMKNRPESGVTFIIN